MTKTTNTGSISIKTATGLALVCGAFLAVVFVFTL